MRAAVGAEARVPLIQDPESGGLRSRRRKNLPRWEPNPEDWDPDIPYGGKVYLARKKKPDGLFCIALQIGLILLCAALLYVAYYHGDLVHLHMTHSYARVVGDKHAQHHMGHRYLYGKGVEQNDTLAMEWFRKAADQGHPHASYNLAIGRLKGMHEDTYPGEVDRLIRHAAEHGVQEAQHVLDRVCNKGDGCDI